MAGVLPCAVTKGPQVDREILRLEIDGVWYLDEVSQQAPRWGPRWREAECLSDQTALERYVAVSDLGDPQPVP